MERGEALLASTLLTEAMGLTTDDLRTQLRSALRDSNSSAEYEEMRWLSAVMPVDDMTGELVYEQGGKFYRCAYELTGEGDSRGTVLHLSGAQEVIPRTTFDVAEGTTVLERKIPKAELDKAKTTDFAGRGRSFPILTPEDVAAAAASMGRAGADNYSTDQIKANIIRIAKRKGASFVAQLPKAWMEARRESAAEAVLVEGATFCEDIPLSEAAQADYLIKLIQPGQGSSAFYPREVLREQGPKVFTAGTQMFWNHQTPSEEAERPEGNLNDLAAVLTSNAFYDMKGPKGEGLYARAKVFADYAQKVEEMGPHIGVSIRAWGTQDSDGKLTGFTRAQSADFVTKAGAGGAVVQESARAGQSQHEESNMDKAEVQGLISEAMKPLQTEIATLKTENATVKAENQTLREGRTRDQARAIIAEKMRESKLPTSAAKQRVLDAILAQALPLTEAQTLDEAKLGEAIIAAEKAEATYLAEATGSGRVTGFGAPAAAAEAKPGEIAERRKARVLETMPAADERAKRFAAAFAAGREGVA